LTNRSSDEAAIALFAGPGEARALAREVDWAASALGPVRGWPEALRGAVRLCLDSPTSLAIWAGAEFTLIHNDAYLPFLGAKARFAMGRPARVVWAEIWAALGPEFEGVLRGGAPTRHEDARYVIRRNGADEEGFFTFTVSPIRDAAGAVIGLFNVSVETTQAVHVAARLDVELREASRRLRLATSAAAIGIYEVDLSSGEVQLDARARQVLGLAEGSGATYGEVLSLVHPDDAAARAAALERAFDPSGDGRYAIEYRVQGAAGAPVRWVASAGQVSFATGRPVTLVGAVQDVTERKRTEDAARGAQERLSAIIDQLPIAVGVLDADGRVVLGNRALDAYGIKVPPSRDPEMRPKWTLFDHGGQPLPPELWPAARALRGEDVSPGLSAVFRPDPSTEVHAIVSAVPLRSGSGERSGVIVVVHDVTAMKRVEEELRQTDRQKAEFLAVLSHELRNPLAPIRNSLHLLERAPPGSDLAGRAREVLNRQTEHLTRLVDDLLDVTRISRGKVELQCSRVDLRDVVHDTAEDLRAVFDARGVSLCVELAAGDVTVHGDPVRLSQVLANLLNNAAKFTPAGGTVTVGLSAQHGAAVLSVRDTGEGMEPDEIERMFQPFAQARQGIARTRGGLGLGLALVKGFVEMHGGTVRATSRGPGQGTVFEVTLPLARSAGGAAADDERETVSKPACDVLIIEDNADAADSLADLLAVLGHRVQVATDGRGGLALARARRPDVILCDIGLPDISGYEVARAVRSEPALANARLVALTGHAQPEDRERAEQAGFDVHLPKPPRLDVLERLLAQAASFPSTPGP
jgi:PAS domain S-box-containing protein